MAARPCDRTTQLAQTIPDEPFYDIPGTAGLIRVPGEGKTLTYAGTSVTFKAMNEDAAGGWTMLELSLAPGFGGPLPHYHRVKTETYYVLEGRIVFMLEWQEMALSAGAMVMVKPGAVHTFWNVGTGQARMMVMSSPLGTEGYYEAMAAMSDRERQSVLADRAQWMAKLVQYDLYPVWE
ncbi:MAG: cupin domain-containing protein [Anaerolineae bacterium]|nr:MAG: cupin domain-containing protein [Anaerolineae bacterium]